MSAAIHPTSGDVPRVLKLRVVRDGGHARVRVYMGQEGSPGYCGELMFRADEYREFRDVLMLGIAAPGPRASISYEGDADVWLNPPEPADCEGVVAQLRGVFGGVA